MPRISVIILSWNGIDLLKRCMATVDSQTYTDFEIIVVDNGSSDGTDEWLRTRHPSARVIRNTENQGFCAGNNQAIREARGECVFLLNNDAELAPDCLERLMEAVDLDPEFGMFATRIMMYDRPNVFDSTGLLVYPDGVCRSRGWLEKDVGQYDDPDEVLGPNGCAALYRRSMLNDVGVFDERYFAYLEDLDLAFRGQLRGWKCRYVPDAVVLHKKSMTSGYHSAFKAYLVERNRIFNAIKLFPRRLLLLSPIYTLARYIAQAVAAVTGKGISSTFARDYSHWQLLWILLRSYGAAALMLPELWRERREIQARRRLGALAVYVLMKKYRLPVLELTFKD
jgi:GT2 family glycosyltransferase